MSALSRFQKNTSDLKHTSSNQWPNSYWKSANWSHVVTGRRQDSSVRDQTLWDSSVRDLTPWDSSVRDQMPWDSPSLFTGSWETLATYFHLHSLVSVSTFVPSETLTKFILLYPKWPPGSAPFPCFNPANQMRSFKMAFLALVLFIPGSRQSISVCEDVDSTEKWLKAIPRTLIGKVLKLQWKISP